MLQNRTSVILSRRAVQIC